MAGTSVRPQDDFYRHWLGQWLTSFEIPEDKAEFASFTDLHDTSQDQLRSIIRTCPPKNPSRTPTPGGSPCCSTRSWTPTRSSGWGWSRSQTCSRQ